MVKEFLCTLWVTKPAFGIKYSRTMIDGGIEKILGSAHAKSGLMRSGKPMAVTHNLHELDRVLQYSLLGLGSIAYIAMADLLSVESGLAQAH